MIVDCHGICGIYVEFMWSLCGLKAPEMLLEVFVRVEQILIEAVVLMHFECLDPYIDVPLAGYFLR